MVNGIATSGKGFDRTQSIRVRLSEDEKGTIEAEARKLGLSASDFIRFLVNRWRSGGFSGKS